MRPSAKSWTKPLPTARNVGTSQMIVCPIPTPLGRSPRTNWEGWCRITSGAPSSQKEITPPISPTGFLLPASTSSHSPAWFALNYSLIPSYFHVGIPSADPALRISTIPATKIAAPCAAQRTNSPSTSQIEPPRDWWSGSVTISWRPPSIRSTKGDRGGWGGSWKREERNVQSVFTIRSKYVSRIAGSKLLLFP